MSFSTPRAADRNLTDPKSLSRTNTQVFEDTFAYKDDWESISVENIRNSSPVVLELRTNVIVSYLQLTTYLRHPASLLTSIYTYLHLG